MSNYAGAEWLEKQLKCDGKKLSDFGRKVADLLGDAFGGIYHIDEFLFKKKVDWSNSWHVQIPYNRDLATFDFNTLTRLVVLCHDRCIRMSIKPTSPGYLYLQFWSRDGREGDVSKRHPTIETAIELVRSGCKREAQPEPISQ